MLKCQAPAGQSAVVLLQAIQPFQEPVVSLDSESAAKEVHSKRLDPHEDDS